jgi:hypothetical protein
MKIKKPLFFIILFLLVLLANCATEQTIFGQQRVLEQKCDAPIWNVGDSWRHRYSNRKEWQYTVERVEEDSYVVDDYYGGCKKYFDKKTLRLVAETDPNGVKKPADSRWFIDFPIHPGKKWNKTFKGIPQGGFLEVNYLYEYKVISYEDTTVPAGTFKAFKIELKSTNYGGKFASGKAYSWYSPEVKYIIKTEYEKIPYFRENLDSYLIKFNLKDKQSSLPEGKLTPGKLDTTSKAQTPLPEKPQISSVLPPPGVEILSMPQLKEGDSWVRQSEKGKFIWEIERIDDSGMILRQGKNKYYYDNEFGEIKKTSDQKTVYELTPSYKGWHSYPLWVGKKWENNFKEKNLEKGYIYAFNELVEIKDWENVETPAGIFKALKIDITRVNLDTGGRWTYTFWYSPDVKGLIKSLSKDLPAQNWTLAEFKLAKVEPPTKAPPVENPPPQNEMSPL